MILETTIKPRADGTVIGRMPDKTGYVFTPGADGVLSCDVTDEGHIAWLIGTGLFYPASSDDFWNASALVAGAAHEIAGDEGESEPDDEGDENAPLIEEPVLNARKPRKIAK